MKNFVTVAEGARGKESADTSIPALLQESQIAVQRNAGQSSAPATDLSLLQTLNTVLIEPITEHLPRTPEEQVIIIPHRSLFKVPFAALLNDNEEYLIDRHPLSIVPSIHALSYAPRREPSVNKQVLIAGNPALPLDATEKVFPPLPGAEEEANAIAEMFNIKAFLGVDATESIIREKFSEANIIHLAAHGQFDSELSDSADGSQIRPGSYLVLAPDEGEDGYLDTEELIEVTREQKVQAELVVMSACNTGVGEIKGDGVLGLSRVLTASGVPSVLVSMWAVGDQSTAKLMKEFYTNVYKQGMTKAEGLRAAMIAVREEYPDPGNWAGFVLIGQPQ